MLVIILEGPAVEVGDCAFVLIRGQDLRRAISYELDETYSRAGKIRMSMLCVHRDKEPLSLPAPPPAS